MRLYAGHVLNVLREMADQSVQTIVTSPPYWGLRNYGTDNPNELGQEPSPEEYVAKMVEIGAQLHRVLRDDGTFWLNIGDSFNANQGTGFDLAGRYRGGNTDRQVETAKHACDIIDSGLDQGNLLGMPWRTALALRAWGWVLRMDNIWHKPSPMPESIRNRCTKAHEYVFLLTKQGSGYYYDHEAIKEEAIHAGRIVKATTSKSKNAQSGDKVNDQRVRDGFTKNDKYVSDRNKRSVWTIDDECTLFDWLAEHHPEALEAFLRESSNRGDVWTISHGGGYKGSHFATFPPRLAETCVLAGTSEHGACDECGTAWRRVVEEQKVERSRPHRYTKRIGAAGTGNSCANDVAGVETVTVGWEPRCECGTEDVMPCVVLDPFVGSGTTAAVCVTLKSIRRCVGIDLSREYLADHAAPRVNAAIRRRPTLHGLMGPETRTVSAVRPIIVE